MLNIIQINPDGDQHPSSQQNRLVEYSSRKNSLGLQEVTEYAEQFPKFAPKTFLKLLESKKDLQCKQDAYESIDDMVEYNDRLFSRLHHEIERSGVEFITNYNEASIYIKSQIPPTNYPNLEYIGPITATDVVRSIETVAELICFLT